MFKGIYVLLKLKLFVNYFSFGIDFLYFFDFVLGVKSDSVDVVLFAFILSVNNILDDSKVFYYFIRMISLDDANAGSVNDNNLFEGVVSKDFSV